MKRQGFVDWIGQLHILPFYYILPKYFAAQGSDKRWGIYAIINWQDVTFFRFVH